MEQKLQIALLGGGPSALFMFKKLLESGRTDMAITIFEKNDRLGCGMPYSHDGANPEHITNVSGNEIPELVTPITEWIRTAPRHLLDQFHINPENYNDYKVLPRLLFGHYLSAQFDLLREMADKAGLEYQVRYNSKVTDIVDEPAKDRVLIEVNQQERIRFDRVVISTGHIWPKKNEGNTPGYFDSPYPPDKLMLKADHAVAIRGSSLTAIDGIRTLAKANGQFIEKANGKPVYQLAEGSEDFKIVMHSTRGLLPSVRFHLRDPHLSGNDTLSNEEMEKYRAAHDGFLSLDYLFEQNFKEAIRNNDPEFYQKIRGMNMEEFVDMVMNVREHVEPFHLFRAEYVEAEKSIERRESVYWKEMLAILSYSLNHPAKYLPAEDMLRLQRTLMPLISIVIAFVPQSSVEQLLALHDAGVLDIICVDSDSYVEPAEQGGATYHYQDEHGNKQERYYKTYVDCVGQPHMNYEDLPYKSLLENHTVTKARLRFKDVEAGEQQKINANDKVTQGDDHNYYLQVPGIAINDSYQVLNIYGEFNPRVYMMSVPYIGGFNPDYSGLDFCDMASDAIMRTILNDDRSAK